MDSVALLILRFSTMSPDVLLNLVETEGKMFPYLIAIDARLWSYFMSLHIARTPCRSKGILDCISTTGNYRKLIELSLICAGYSTCLYTARYLKMSSFLDFQQMQWNPSCNFHWVCWQLCCEFRVFCLKVRFPLTFFVCSTQVILRKGDAGALSPRGAMLNGLLYAVALLLALILRWQAIRTPISCLQKRIWAASIPCACKFWECHIGLAQTWHTHPQLGD